MNFLKLFNLVKCSQVFQVSEAKMAKTKQYVAVIFVHPFLTDFEKGVVFNSTVFVFYVFYLRSFDCVSVIVRF